MSPTSSEELGQNFVVLAPGEHAALVVRRSARKRPGEDAAAPDDQPRYQASTSESLVSASAERSEIFLFTNHPERL